MILRMSLRVGGVVVISVWCASKPFCSRVLVFCRIFALSCCLVAVSGRDPQAVARSPRDA